MKYIYRFWQFTNEVETQIYDFTEEYNTVIQKKEYTMELLDKLRSTNVCNDSFHISRDGHFGTINGMRLGTLPSLPVGYIINIPIFFN